MFETIQNQEEIGTELRHIGMKFANYDMTVEELVKELCHIMGQVVEKHCQECEDAYEN